MGIPQLTKLQFELLEEAYESCYHLVLIRRSLPSDSEAAQLESLSWNEAVKNLEDRGLMEKVRVPITLTISPTDERADGLVGQQFKPYQLTPAGTSFYREMQPCFTN